jgi:hypothetical protein
LSVRKGSRIETLAVRTLKMKVEVRRVRRSFIKNNGRLKDFFASLMGALKDIK